MDHNENGDGPCSIKFSIKRPDVYSNQYLYNRRGIAFIGGYAVEQHLIIFYIGIEIIGGSRSDRDSTFVPSRCLGIPCVTIYLVNQRK